MMRKSDGHPRPAATLDKARAHTYNGGAGRLGKHSPGPARVLLKQTRTTTVNSICLKELQRGSAVAWVVNGLPQAARCVDLSRCSVESERHLGGATPAPDAGRGLGFSTSPTNACDYSVMSGPPSSQRWPVLYSVAARSISTGALDTLYTGAGRVVELARFDRAIDLIIGDALVALVLPEIGNGPFHVVVDRLPGAGTAWQITRAGLTIGPCHVAITSETEVWDPSPPWSEVAIQPHCIQILERIAVEITDLRRTRSGAQEHLDRALEQRIAELAAAIARGCLVDIQKAAAGLAGLGPGLTPYGDDVLAGAALALWAAHHPLCGEIGAAIARAAVPVTHSLSGAFLDAAGHGLASADWHALLEALGGDDFLEVEHAARRVAATGGTSGRAMLRGFIVGYSAARRDS